MSCLLASLTQPDGTPIPAPLACDGGQPIGVASTLACICTDPGVCNIGAPCTTLPCDPGVNSTCETTLWHTFNDDSCLPSQVDGLDPVQDALVVPQTFAPRGTQTVTLRTRGTTTFGNALYWYNATAAAPVPADLHALLDCQAAPGSSVVVDLLADPAYAGGAIGFALVTPESHVAPGTCAGGDCCASPARLTSGDGYAYFSEPAYDPDEAGPDSPIHLLQYESRIEDRRVILAWDDRHGGGDNDFTDLVVSVGGVDCDGGGEPCTVEGVGACASGTTTCSQGALTCEANPPQDETCDGADNDCDGVIDGAGLCPEGSECDQGTCAVVDSPSDSPDGPPGDTSPTAGCGCQQGGPAGMNLWPWTLALLARRRARHA